MKVKTSVTISEQVLCEIDEAIGKGENRSQFVEKAVKRYLREKKRRENWDKEVAILNGIADGTLAEPPDAWEYGSQHYWDAGD